MAFLNLQFMGRFGNQLFQYAFAKAYCEQAGIELCCGPWVGDKLFNLDHAPARLGLERMEESKIIRGLNLKNGVPFLPLYQGNIELRSYFQQQDALIYTRTQVKKWFQLKPEIEFALAHRFPLRHQLCAHRRLGDYMGYGYPVPSIASYEHAAFEYNLGKEIHWVTEEAPVFMADFPGEMDFLPDFYRCMTSEVLLRGNSSFSWWAATLGDGRVFSPVIEGLQGGMEHHCHFIEGNWPRFTNLDFVTDLRLSA